MARKRYTDKFRAAAVVMLEAEGYPAREGAPARVSEHLSVLCVLVSDGKADR